MPLDPSRLYPAGTILEVKTVGGWGWQFCTSALEQQMFEVPSPFAFELAEVLTDNGKYAALLGKCVTPGHPFAEMWSLLIPRLDREVTLDEETPFNILITPSKPRLSGSHPPPHPHSIVADEFPQWRGYADAVTINPGANQ